MNSDKLETVAIYILQFLVRKSKMPRSINGAPIAKDKTQLSVNSSTSNHVPRQYR